MAKFNVILITVFLVSSLFVFISTEDTVKIEVLKEAAVCDRKAKKGDDVSMHYSGKLVDGKEFDSSYSRKKPFDFKLGAGEVIAGWEEGVAGMCIGEKRKLTIPPALAYGEEGFEDVIPAKSTLIFEVELMAIKEDDGSPKEELDTNEDQEHEHPDSFEAIDANNDKQITSEEMTNYIKKFNEEGTDEKFENIDTIVSEIFQEDDKNKDGVISFEEYQHFEEQDEGDTESPYVDEDAEEEEPPQTDEDNEKTKEEL